MAKQFPIIRFARGTKLPVQAVNTPLTAINTAAASAEFANTVEEFARCKVTWLLPWIGSAAAQATEPIVQWPFVAPPYQQLFNRTTLADPRYPVILREICLSLDQRAEPFAVAGPGSAAGGGGAPTAGIGQLTNADMERYNMTLILLERQPSLLTGDVKTANEIGRWQIDGSRAFGIQESADQGPAGNGVARANPLVITDLDLPMRPWNTYCWQIHCDGLWNVNAEGGAATVEMLELVSLNLTATLESPLTVRDKANDFVNSAKPIQNLPTVHGGNKQGTTIPLTPVVGGVLITGDDVQGQFHGVDRALRNRAASGYGTGYGPLATPVEAADRSPQELLANDAHYTMIMVPMWHGQFQESVRKRDVATAGLRFYDPAQDATTEEIFAFPVPEGFVLHHAFAVWNGYSPPTTVYANHNTWGIWPTSTNYKQEVGIVISNGWHGDENTTQQVAYLQWTGDAGNYPQWLLDEYSPDGHSRWRLLQIPMVDNDVAWAWPGGPPSWFDNGPPFFTGRGETNTAARANAGTLPRWTGAATPYAASKTHGAENVMIVKWKKYLSDIANWNNEVVIVGQGGEWVVLCGRQVLTV